jgi:hypothetical protein
MGGEGESWERKWMKRGRMSCWEGEQWILAWESEGDESRDEKVMVKLIV